MYRRLRDWDLDQVTSWIARIGELFGEAGPLPPMTEETRQHLRDIYEDEIRELESLLQIDLERWK